MSLTTSQTPAIDTSEIDTACFRQAMRDLAGGVTVVTVGKGAGINGFTATSVTSLCLYPPRVLVCLAQSSSSWNVLQRHRCFGINLLRDEEHGLADRFAGRDGLKGAARFAGVRWTTMLTGAPVLDNVL